MPQIWIRHSEKLFGNGKGEPYAFDSPLTHNGYILAKNKMNSLIEEFGPPSYIVCSPYLRTRQTAYVLEQCLKSLESLDFEIIIDRNIGEFINKHHYVNFKSDFDPVTLSYKPIIRETMSNLKTRIYNYKSGLDDSYHNTWFITHGIVVSQIFSFYKQPKTVINYCDCAVIDNNGNIIKR